MNDSRERWLDMVAMNQRSQQINLLKKQQAEADRLKSLPKCPECATPLESGVSICRGCQSRIAWLPLDGRPLSLQSLGSKIPAIVNQLQAQLTDAWNAYRAAGVENLPQLYEALASLHDHAIGNYSSLQKAEVWLADFEEQREKLAKEVKRLERNLEGRVAIGCGTTVILLLLVCLGILLASPDAAVWRNPVQLMLPGIFWSLVAATFMGWGMRKGAKIRMLLSSLRPQLDQPTPTLVSTMTQAKYLTLMIYPKREAILTLQSEYQSVLNFAGQHGIVVSNTFPTLAPATRPNLLSDSVFHELVAVSQEIGVPIDLSRRTTVGQSPSRKADVGSPPEVGVVVKCPGCGVGLRLSREKSGAIKCPKCQTRFESKRTG